MPVFEIEKVDSFELAASINMLLREGCRLVVVLLEVSVWISDHWISVGFGE